MLTTQSPGCLRARPLEAQPERDCGLIWFVTDVRSGKEYDIEPSTMCAWSSSTPTPKPTSRRPVAAAAPACPALLQRIQRRQPPAASGGRSTRQGLDDECAATVASRN